MKQDKTHSECGSCYSPEKWLLHTVSIRGTYRRLCTSCVLKLHPGLFCPNCFEVYEGCNPPPVNRVICLKCPSVCHPSCVSKEIAHRYVCPTCLNPSHLFFDSSKSKRDGGEGVLVPNENHQEINLDLAKVLLAAAQIASVSMNKAASVARVEAEKRVKEATLAKKRVREALERVSSLALKEKEKNDKESVGVETVSRPVVVSVVDESRKKPKTDSAVAAAVAAQKRFQDQVVNAGTNGKDNGTPLVRHNFVARRNENSVGLSVRNVEQKIPTNHVMGRPQGEKLPTMSEKEMSSSFFRPHTSVVQGEGKSGLVANAHSLEQNMGKSKRFADSGTVPQLTHSNEVMKEFYHSRDVQDQKANCL